MKTLILLLFTLCLSLSNKAQTPEVSNPFPNSPDSSVESTVTITFDSIVLAGNQFSTIINNARNNPKFIAVKDSSNNIVLGNPDYWVIGYYYVIFQNKNGIRVKQYYKSVY